MMNQQKPQRIKTRHTLNGVVIEMDRASWAEMMTAIGIAIDHSDQERAASLKKLRTALSQAEPARK